MYGVRVWTPGASLRRRLEVAEICSFRHIVGVHRMSDEAKVARHGVQPHHVAQAAQGGNALVLRTP